MTFKETAAMYYVVSPPQKKVKWEKCQLTERKSSWYTLPLSYNELKTNV
jgi:hypothetical protein